MTPQRIDVHHHAFPPEYLTDTTRAVPILTLSGTLDRYPNIRWILAHAGAAIPVALGDGR